MGARRRFEGGELVGYLYGGQPQQRIAVDQGEMPRRTLYHRTDPLLHIPEPWPLHNADCHAELPRDLQVPVIGLGADHLGCRPAGGRIPDRGDKLHLGTGQRLAGGVGLDKEQPQIAFYGLRSRQYKTK